MSTKFTNSNYENIQKRFSNETGVQFKNRHKRICLNASAKIAVVCVCLTAACAGTFATDAGKAILEKLSFSKPVESSTISYGYKEGRKPIKHNNGGTSDTNTPEQDESSDMQSSMWCMPLDPNEISSDYSLATDPGHLGIDIQAEKGSPVYPVLNGTVFETGYTPEHGNYIILKHEGDYTSTYAHLDTILVEAEQVVETTTQIGTVGKTGMATGPHLHLEMTYNGHNIDPTGYIFTEDPPDSFVPGNPEEWN